VTRLALLGDSIAWGQGARTQEDRLAARLTRGLDAAGHHPDTQVFAVPGAQSADLARQVDRAVEWGPHVSVVIIGANDLTHFVPVEQAASDLAAAVRRLRTQGSEVVITPAPDLSIVQHVPPALRQLVRAASERLRSLQVAVARDSGARVADDGGVSTERFRIEANLFSADRFHPSSAGYAVIAETLLPEVLAAAAAVG
jgi:lysophospholipase L1-like esterase